MTSAAEAALAAMRPPAQPDRLAWVDVEVAPQMIEVLDPVDQRHLGWYAKVEDDRISDQMLTVLRRVCDEGDQAECQADDCQNGPGYRRNDVPVPASIGWTDHDTALAGRTWTPVTLVQRSKHVIAVCEGCSPSSIYQGLWPVEGRPA